MSTFRNIKIEKMSVLDEYLYHSQQRQIDKDELSRMKHYFELEMANAYIANKSDSDLPLELDLMNLYIFKDMFDWIFQTYSNYVIECNNNREEALTRLTNKFVEICRIFLNIELRYSSALFVMKNILFGYEYRRSNHYVAIPDNNNFEFCFEVVCNANY